jgi:cytochrome c biogenesis protein CcmG/thiol:disulfide interchange protein DsbE
VNNVAWRAGTGVAGLLIVGLIALMGWGISSKAPATALSGVTRVQKPAPDFVLPLLDGGELALSELRGRPLVINFWASWCPPCREEALLLERSWQQHRDEVTFVGVDIQDSESAARAYLAEFHVTYPNGRDLDGRITIDYGVIGLPVTFFVNRAGIVERRWVGAVDDARLTSWIGELISGEAPSGETEGANLEGFRELR